MQKSLLAALLGTALIAPLAAHAEGSYVGVNVGQSTYQDILLSGGDQSKTLVGLNYGMAFNPNFDIEVGYVYHGRTSDTDTASGTTLKIDTQSLYLAAVGKLPLAEGVNVYGKAGLATNYNKAVAADSSGSAKDTNTKVGILLGVGVSYQFTKEWSGLIEYAYFDKPSDGDFKLSNWTAGVRYHF